MRARVLKAFSSPRWGNKSAGDYIEDSEQVIRQLAEHGMVELLEKKPHLSGATEAKPLRYSPAAPVPQQPTPKQPDATAELSVSTDPTNSLSVTSPTDATIVSGPDTTKRPKKRARKSGR